MAEMLTAVDQPLDKLEDLTQEEKYVYVYLIPIFSLTSRVLYSDNMRGIRCIIIIFCMLNLTSYDSLGWMEHFSSKYIICGKLVENDAV